MTTHGKKNRSIPAVITAVLAAVTVVAVCIAVGSVYITPGEIFSIFGHKLFGRPLPPDFDMSRLSILWNIRIPRVFMSFFVGGALSVSGAVMQSVLKNPLASSYTLGVSSGASLGVVIVMVSEISVPFLGSFLSPAAGFISGFMTVMAVLLLSSVLERGGRNNTVILIGMVLSLFLNAVTTLIASFNTKHQARISIWQTGSFAGKNMTHVLIMAVVSAVSLAVLMFFSRELDILTFGDEQGASMGVSVKRVKNIVLAVTALLTGVAVSFSGIIGFIDLIAPHVVRKVCGNSNRIVLPMTMIAGGTFMALADLVARTILSPREIAVGAVTAIIGAPFFAYVYFRGRRNAHVRGN